MDVQKHATIYGEAAECREAMQLLASLPAFDGWQLCGVDSWTCLQQELEQHAAGLLMVLSNGAAGMEGVFLARQLCPELPVFWFSDDCGFGMQSHRLECAYFASKPLTNDKLSKALHHCEKLGIQL